MISTECRFPLQRRWSEKSRTRFISFSQQTAEVTGRDRRPEQEALRLIAAVPFEERAAPRSPHPRPSCTVITLALFAFVGFWRNCCHWAT